MHELAMELRSVDEPQRLVVGVVVPYDELTYLTPDPRGERVKRGAFARSIAHRGDRIPVFRNHDRSLRMGVSRSFTESHDGLLGEFRINDGDPGDALLEEARSGYLGGLSAGFIPLDRGRSADGAAEVIEGKLEEVSLVGHPAYAGSVLAVRNAQDLDDLLAPFRARPDVNLSPIPPMAYRRP